MTGPEHYVEAEDYLVVAEVAREKGQPENAALYLQKAQVHATLALAAATADLIAAGRSTDAAWKAVLL